MKILTSFFFSFLFILNFINGKLKLQQNGPQQEPAQSVTSNY